MDVDSKIVKLSPTYSFKHLQSCKHILLTHQTLPSRVFFGQDADATKISWAQGSQGRIGKVHYAHLPTLSKAFCFETRGL
jgi:hypothetical protein